MDKKTSNRLDSNTPALALSGGGFRVTLFHCGALLRLNELGYLTRLSPRPALAWPNLSFDNIAATSPNAAQCESYAFPPVAPTAPFGVSKTAEALIVAAG